MDKVAAVILNYNSSADCCKCMEYLRKQDYNDLEIIVVDNASTCGTELEKLGKACAIYEAQLLRNTSNSGFSAGNNIGIKKALADKAKWCLIINPDVELRDKSYISKIMESVREWPDTAVVGSNIVLPSGVWQNPQRESGFWEDFLWPIQLVKEKNDKKSNRYLCERKTGYCQKVCGACFFISAAAVKKIGYLDEGVFMFSEEAILSVQIKKIAKKILYVNEVTAYHEHYASKKKSAGMRMAQFIESRLYYYEKFSEYSSVQRTMLRISLGLKRKCWEFREENKFWKKKA